MLLTLAYEKFAQRISLRLFTGWNQQQRLVETFQQRVRNVLREHAGMSLREAEYLVRQELEQKLQVNYE
jgi:hypothetical protein